MLDDLPKSTLKVFLEIEPVNAAPLIVVACYRPPNATVDAFDQIERCLQFLDRDDKEIILLGDTKCYFLPKYSKEDDANSDVLPTHSLHLLEIYNLLVFQKLIKSASRKALTTTTLIDHIATTNKSNIMTSGINLVYCVRKFCGSSKNSKNIYLLGK